MLAEVSEPAFERTERIESHLTYARVIAYRMHSALGLGVAGIIELEDFASEAYIALIRAVDAFDRTRGVPLKGYISGRVSGHLMHVIRRLDPKGRYNRQTINAGERWIARNTNTHQRMPTSAEVEAAVPGFTAASLRATQRACIRLDAPCVSLVQGGEMTDVSTIGEQLATTDEAVETTAITNVDRERLWHLIGTLPALERAALILRYRDAKTIADIGLDLGLSGTYVDRILYRAMRRLREGQSRPLMSMSR